MSIWTKIFGGDDKSKNEEVKSEKDLATERGEPYVKVVTAEINKSQPHVGEFEIDYNDFFVKLLIQHGYEGRDADQIVDQWFQTVCRHVVLESYEKHEQMVTRTELGDGRASYE